MDKRMVTVFVLAGLALASCGSSNNATTTTATTAAKAPPAGATEIGTPPPVKSASYTIALSGATGQPAGAPGASARGVVQIKASSDQLCWQFTGLKNVAAPTRARIYRSLAGG